MKIERSLCVASISVGMVQKKKTVYKGEAFTGLPMGLLWSQGIELQTFQLCGLKDS